MNKNKQVSHSKVETISVIFMHSSPNPFPPQNKVWQYNVTDLTLEPEIPKIIAVLARVIKCW